MGCVIKRILQLKQAINFIELKLYDISNVEITNNCMYSWSTDGVCWTNWTTYNNYLNIAKNINQDFYLRIKLFGSFDKLYCGTLLMTPNCYSIVMDSENPFIHNFCELPNLFQPYQNLDCALLLQQLLSDSIVCMFGIPIYYIKVKPDLDTADYTFKEYVMHNVESIKLIKLMIPDGQMPSSNPKLTDFDFDWETDWEVEISKTQFATAFGDDAFPVNRDFIYIPMMKRMWEVNSAYDEKNEGLMWRSTTWKLALAKYNDATNVNLNEFGDIVDSWVNGLEYANKIAPIELNELERETGNTPISAPSFAATNLFDIFIEDAVRKQYTKLDVVVIDKNYCHRNMIVARNLYKFKNENGCIVYQKGICGDSGTIMFIMDVPGTLDGKLEKTILDFGNVQLNIEYKEKFKTFWLRFNTMLCEIKPFNTYMVMMKWNRLNFTSELNVYKYTHKEGVPVYTLKPDMYWFDFENPVNELTIEYNNAYIMPDPMECQLHAYPVQISNVKYYNKYLDKVDSIKESLKYTTQHESCVINDLARPISSGHGYNVR